MTVSASTTSSVIRPEGATIVAPAESVIVERALEATRAIFPGSIEIESDSDPKDATRTWWNVWVQSNADHAELRSLRRAWHESIERLSDSDSSRFRLQVRRP